MRNHLRSRAEQHALSQKQFLGSKYLTVLHENLRDIALKMYVLCS